MIIFNNTDPELVMISICSEDIEAMPKPVQDFYSYAKKYFFDEDIYFTFYPSCHEVNGEPALEAEPVNGLVDPVYIKLADLNLTDTEMGKLFKYIMLQRIFA